MSVSGLIAAGEDATMLHHPHQVGDAAAPGDRFVQVVDFDSPAFNRNNRVDIQSMDMVVDDAWIEFQIPQLTASGATVSRLAEVQTWLNSNGMQILYKNQSIYTMSEAEAVWYMYMNPPNQNMLVKMLDSSNDVADSVRSTRALDADGFVYYMWLGPIVKKIFSHAGPINAYASKAFSLVVGLLPTDRIIQSDSGTPTLLSIDSMRLILSGHREDQANAQRVADALATGGVRISFNQANHLQTAFAASATTHTVNLSNLEGEVTGVQNLFRNTTALTSTTASTNDHLTWELFPFNQQTIEIGTQSNPTRVFGLALPMRTIKLVEQGESYTGSPIFVDRDGLVRDTSILSVALAEAGTMGQKFGTVTGNLRVKNDFQEVFRFSSTQLPANNTTVDTIVYVLRDMLIKHEGIVMMNREQ